MSPAHSFIFDHNQPVDAPRSRGTLFVTQNYKKTMAVALLLLLGGSVLLGLGLASQGIAAESIGKRAALLVGAVCCFGIGYKLGTLLAEASRANYVSRIELQSHSREEQRMVRNFERALGEHLIHFTQRSQGTISLSLPARVRPLHFETGGIAHPNGRPMEDRCFIDETEGHILAGIFDGDGEEGAQVAEQLRANFTQTFLEEEPTPDTMISAFEETVAKICAQVKVLGICSFTACYINKETNRIYTANLGTTRAFIIREGNQIPLSKGVSAVGAAWSQDGVEKPQVTMHELRMLDRLIIGSSGLWRRVKDVGEMVTYALYGEDLKPKPLAQALIQDAIDEPHPRTNDNVSVIVVQV